MSPTPSPLARAYFDTEALIAHGWPLPSADLEILLIDADLLGIACAIPEPVLRELQQRWLRDTRSDLSAARKLTKRLSRISASRLPSIPDEPECLEAYAAHVRSTMARHHLLTCPFTSRGAAEVFGYSVSRALTFTADKDVGFQDAVILLSVLDHCEAALPAIFVSGDAAFSSSETSALIASSQKPLRVVNSLSALRADFDARFAAEADLHGRIDRLRIATAVYRRYDELKQFVTTNARFFTLFYSPPGCEITAFNDLTLQQLDEDAVNVNWVDRADESARVAISLTIPATLNLTVEYYGSRFPRPLRIGESRPEPTASEIAESLVPLAELQRWTALVVVDAETIASDSDFRDMRFVDVRLENLQPPAPES